MRQWQQGWLGVVLVLGGVVLLGGYPARRVAAAAPDLTAVMRAFMAAYNRQDVAGMRALAAPDFAFVQDVHYGGTTLDFQGFVAYPPATATITRVTPRGPDTLEVALVFSGSTLPPLPHPFVDQVTFTFRAGQITRMVEQVGPQTLQDLAAAHIIAPLPGMPRTGTPVAWPLGVIPALAAIAGGLLLRRRAAARRPLARRV